MTLAFLIVVLSLTVAHALAGPEQIMAAAVAMGIPSDFATLALFDVVLVVVIVALGFLAQAQAAPASVVLPAGATAAFVILSVHQSELVRYLTLAAALFVIGIYGMLVSRNAVRVLISIELMLNAVNINLVAFSRFLDPAYIHGQVFAVFVLTVAAAEAAVGLAIVLAIYRNMATVDMERFTLLKW